MEILPLGFFFFIDPMYLVFIAPAFLLAFVAQIWVKSAFAKYSRVKNTRGITGAEAARRILRENGIDNVEVLETRGTLSDHYDPKSHTVNLSPEVYNKPSVAAVGIAAHEVGHAIQHNRGYAPLALRHFMVPAVTLGSRLYVLLLIGGLLMGAWHKSPIGVYLALAGIVLFGVTVLFSIVTLPVEFNASFRAMSTLTDSDILYPEEKAGVRTVLTAASLTYVAAAMQAVLTMLYWLWRLGLLGGNRR